MSPLDPSGNTLSPDTAPAIPLPEKFKTTTHLLCVFAPAVLAILIGILSGGVVLELLLDFLLFAAYVAILYFVAGGFDWSTAKLPIWRIVLFWVLGDLIIALLAWGMWYLIRWGMAKTYGIPLPAVMGRLMATGRKAAAERYFEEYVEKAKFSPAGFQAATCANCGLETNLGASYNLLFGVRLWSTISVGKAETHYRVSDSPDVYLCNKCVALANLRNVMNVLKKVVIGLAALSVILLPVFIIAKDPVYILPTFFLVLVATAAVVFYLNLQGKEEAPLQVYANLYNNPGFPSAKYKLGEAWAKEQAKDNGEKLAIRLKKPSLTKSKSSVFFTHKQMHHMLTGT